MIDFLVEYGWLSTILVTILFLADHYMTVAGATLAAQHFKSENGYELNPFFEKEVAEGKWFTRKHIAILIGIAIYLGLVRWFSAALFELVIGGLIFHEIHLNLQHAKNLLYLKDSRKPGSVNGRLETSYWMAQRQSAWNFIAQAVLIGVVAIAAMRIFYWGGVAALLLNGFKSLFLANRNFSSM